MIKSTATHLLYAAAALLLIAGVIFCILDAWRYGALLGVGGICCGIAAICFGSGKEK